MTDEHLYDTVNEIHRPVVGEIMGVVHVDDPKSPIPNTCYDVQLHSMQPGYVQSFVMPPMPYVGESRGGSHDSQRPLLVGQFVLVDFLEGDPRRPFILQTYSKCDGEVELDPPLRVEHPMHKELVNGTEFQVNKDGSVSILVKSGESISVKKSDGTTQLFKVSDSGQVEAGSVTKSLLTEDFASVLSTIVNTATTGDLLLAALKLAFTAPTGPTSLNDKKTTKLKGE